MQNQTQEVNTEIEPIKIEATDNSGQAVTNKVDGLPDGVTFDEATNTISGTPSEVGSYDITVTTTDKMVILKQQHSQLMWKIQQNQRLKVLRIKHKKLTQRLPDYNRVRR